MVLRNKQWQTTASRWTLTMNCPDGADEAEFIKGNDQLAALERLCDSGEVAYCCMQYERGEKGHLHGQGFLVLKEQHSKLWLRNRLHEITCYKPRKAELQDDEAGRKYCWDENKPGFECYAFEFGSWPDSLADSEVKSRKPSQRDEVARMINAGASYAEIREAYPGYAFEKEALIKRKINQVAAASKLDNYKKKRRVNQPYEPKVWQHWLWRWLDEVDVDDRMILTIVDTRGHSGKNRFIQEYTDAHDADEVQTISAGKEGNLNLVFNPQATVVFLNITRSKSEHTKHLAAFCENLKDGSLFSEKYGSEMKTFAPPKVVVFQNDRIDLGMGGGWYPNALNGNDIEVVKGYNAPYTYDRYLWWELDGAMREPFDPIHNPMFPPFNRVNEEFHRYAFVPPEFGPAYRGDNAGDGPGSTEQIACTRPYYWPIARDRFRRIENTSSWWCMRTGAYFVAPEPDNYVEVYWRYSKHNYAPWYRFILTLDKHGNVHSDKTNVGAQDWFPHFPPTFENARDKMERRRRPKRARATSL